ncbi:MAG: hypothetical protein KC656_20375 [Myxococcales bacterium]|nr:hypothetical protein [Myxococcales bacterium]
MWLLIALAFAVPEDRFPWSAEVELPATGVHRVRVPAELRPAWSDDSSGLALLDAYNRMPTTPDGALDAPLEVCLKRLLTHRVDTAPPAAPGDPVLPDIVAVAVGDETFAAPPTPGCPWPQGVVTTGAKSALGTVSRLAALQLQEKKEN